MARRRVAAAGADKKVFTFWDYRRKSWERDAGLPVHRFRSSLPA